MRRGRVAVEVGIGIYFLILTSTSDSPHPFMRHVHAASPGAIAARLLPRVAGGALAALPFDVELWDGTRIPAAGDPVGVLRVRRTAIGQLLHEPNQLGLTRAFVAGDLDFDGDLESVLALRHRFA